MVCFSEKASLTFRPRWRCAAPLTCNEVSYDLKLPDAPPCWLRSRTRSSRRLLFLERCSGRFRVVNVQICHLLGFSSHTHSRPWPGLVVGLFRTRCFVQCSEILCYTHSLLSLSFISATSSSSSSASASFSAARVHFLVPQRSHHIPG